DVALFAGSGGSLSDTTLGVPNNTPDDFSDDEVVDGNLGVSVSGVSLKLASVTDAAGNKYLGLEAAIANATLIGIENVDLTISGKLLLNQATSAAAVPLAERINWAAADTVPTSTLLPEFNTDENVSP